MEDFLSNREMRTVIKDQKSEVRRTRGIVGIEVLLVTK